MQLFYGNVEYRGGLLAGGGDDFSGMNFGNESLRRQSHYNPDQGAPRRWYMEDDYSGRRPRPETATGNPPTSFHERDDLWAQRGAALPSSNDRILHTSQPPRHHQSQQRLSERASYMADNWTHGEDLDYKYSRPMTTDGSNGIHYGGARTRAHELVEHVTSSALREQLSERDLDLLELKTRQFQETSEFRAALKQREMELIDREQALRKQNDKLQRDREQLQEIKHKHEKEKANFKSKISTYMREADKMRKIVSHTNQKMILMDKKHKEEIARKDNSLARFQRDLELYEARVQKAEAQVATASHTELHLRQTNTDIAAEIASLRSSERKLHEQVDRARLRETELEDALSNMREERERAEDRATRAIRAAEDASRHLSTEKLRAAALEDDVAKLREAVSSMNALRLKQKHDVVTSPKQIANFTADDAQSPLSPKSPGRQEYLEMLGEVKRCLAEVQESKRENTKLEERAAKAESELEELRKIHLKQGQSQGNNKNSPSLNGGHNAELDDVASSARLREELERQEKTLAQAEWDRVAAEQEVQALRTALSDVKKELDEAREGLRDADGLVTDLQDMLESEKGANSELQQQFEDTLFKLDEVEAKLAANQLDAAKHQAQEQGLTRTLMTDISQYLGAVRRLMALLNAFLEGEQPSMDVLLDDVDTLDAGIDFTKLSDQDRIEAVQGLKSKLAASRESVSQVRSRIADRYAETLGSDCNVQ